MKKRIWFLLGLLPLLALGFVWGKDQDKNALLLQLISYGLNQNHYQPQQIDDEFSKKVFADFIDRLDYNKRFLLASDIDQLKVHETQLDNQMSAGQYTFFDLADSITNLRIQQVEPIYKELLAKPFDFDRDEDIEFEGKKLKFVQTTEQLTDRWRLALKYEVMTKLARQLQLQEDAQKQGTNTLRIRPYDSLELEARQKVRENYDKWFARMLKVEKEDRREAYLNTITGIFDPHTNYLPPKRKQDYDIGMSGRLEGIGATLQEDDGFIKIVKIQPGSPSARQGELKEGDLILKVGQADAEPVDVVDMRLDEAVQLIRGKKGTEVRLTVKKVEGAIREVSLIRDVVNIDETFAKSSIIEHRGKNYGLIHLPKFYADFEHRDGRSCATDVGLEIEKLKKDGVKGIVLDLRNNGGGSLQDVVDMTGLFIEAGPIVQVKARGKSPEVLKDNDKKLQWDGPLVVLVNEMSASASEILAAAVQDYQRGLIMGSNSTFGKGTVQRFVDFDNVVQAPFDQYRPLGSMKLTTQKFYRINGETTQLKGVQSDVFLPGAYSYIPMGEKEQDHALAWDVIQALKLPNWGKTPTYDLRKVAERARKRVAQSPEFETIDKGARFMKSRRDDTQATLHLRRYMEQEQKLEETTKKYDALKNYDAKLRFAIPTADASAMADTVQPAARAAWHKELNRDAYLHQAILALGDMQ